VLFTGEYERTIDAKQRLAIPSEIRSRMDPERHGSGLYVTPGANGRAWLWPEKTFEQMAGALEQSLLKGEELMDFDELMFPDSQHCEFDKAGRVRLSERLLKEYNLGETVMILGMKDHLELCDPAERIRKRQGLLERRPEIIMRARRALDEQRNRRPSGDDSQ
jgi:MraZ protein